MAVVIRLRRMGTNKKPFNRIVVCDKRSPRDGRFLEEIGFYNPATNPQVISVNKDRALYWLTKGAEPSDTVKILFKKQGVIKPQNIKSKVKS